MWIYYRVDKDGSLKLGSDGLFAYPIFSFPLHQLNPELVCFTV